MISDMLGEMDLLHKPCKGEAEIEMKNVVRRSEAHDFKIQVRVQECQGARQMVVPGQKRGRPRKTRPQELEVLEGTKESRVLHSRGRPRRKIKAAKKGMNREALTKVNACDDISISGTVNELPGFLGTTVPTKFEMAQSQLNMNLFGSNSERLFVQELEMVQPDINSMKPQLDMNLFGFGSKGMQTQTSTDLQTSTMIVLDNPTPSEEAPSKTQLPFAKKSPLWEILESMEVFKIMPQKPHFCPLEQRMAECREGMAIGHLVNFVNLVDKVRDVRFDDTDSFKDKLELLEDLEQHGFCVQPTQARLEALLKLKERHRVFESDLIMIEAKICEQEHERDELNIEIFKLDMDMMVLKESIVQLQETRVHMINESLIGESEVEKWEKEREIIKKHYADAKREFEGLIATI